MLFSSSQFRHSVPSSVCRPLDLFIFLFLSLPLSLSPPHLSPLFSVLSWTAARGWRPAQQPERRPRSCAARGVEGGHGDPPGASGALVAWAGVGTPHVLLPLLPLRRDASAYVLRSQIQSALLDAPRRGDRGLWRGLERFRPRRAPFSGRSKPPNLTSHVCRLGA